jgi:hypothetical protein
MQEKRSEGTKSDGGFMVKQKRITASKVSQAFDNFIYIKITKNSFEL